MTAKKMLPGQLRFIVKKIGQFFRVYDVGNASYPYRTPELGVVLQDVAEDEAQLEADRLNETFAVAVQEAPKKRGTKSAKSQKTGSAKTVQLEDPPAAPRDPLDLVEFETEEYEMTEDQKKRHEEDVLSGNY